MRVLLYSQQYLKAITYSKDSLLALCVCRILIIGLLLVMFVACSNKVQLKWDPVSVDSPMKDSMVLKVYVENSGSMDGYMCDGSNLKDAVFDYISELEREASSCSLYYINSQIIPCDEDVEAYIKNLTPSAFAKAGGNRGNTDMMQIFDSILSNHNPKTVSILVSDCVLDLGGDTDDYLGRCQISIKNTFNKALKKNPRLGVEIVKMESKFDGVLYSGKDNKYLKNVKRPYYIWIIGDQRYLSALNRKTPIEGIIGGVKEYCAYTAVEKVPFDIAKTSYVVSRNNKISVQVLADLRNLLQSERIICDKSHYRLSNPSQVSIVGIDKITERDSRYSHVLSLEIENPSVLKSANISIVYPQLPAWVEKSDDANTGQVGLSLDKTTGLTALVKGVMKAFEGEAASGTIVFEIKNR